MCASFSSLLFCCCRCSRNLFSEWTVVLLKNQVNDAWCMTRGSIQRASLRVLTFQVNPNSNIAACLIRFGAFKKKKSSMSQSLQPSLNSWELKYDGWVCLKFLIDVLLWPAFLYKERKGIFLKVHCQHTDNLMSLWNCTFRSCIILELLLYLLLQIHRKAVDYNWSEIHAPVNVSQVSIFHRLKGDCNKEIALLNW